MIPNQTIDIIMHSRRSVLFNDSCIWVKKKQSHFDVTQGSYDGAELCELVGIYLLHIIEIYLPNLNTGLYRDDGLSCVTNVSGPQIDRIRKQMTQQFKSCGLKITIEANLTTTDFLDVKLNLQENLYQPFAKPNNQPLYINRNSNHPPSIIKQIPSMIGHRLSLLSSSEREFNEVKHIYEKSLENSGYKDKLNFSPNLITRSANKNRKRKVIWFNPPYSSHVKTNIGRFFMNLLDKHFPKHHRYHKLFNKNNTKLSYCCMPNMEAIITGHNFKILQNKESKNKNMCNCAEPSECPLEGKCLSESIIYRATVSTAEGEKDYIGCSEGKFKLRFNNHTKSFTHKTYRNDTKLSQYIWSLREQDKKFSISWEIAATAAPYMCGSRKCDICLTEKLFISRADPEKLLNSRAEIISTCRHRRKFTLQKFNHRT